MATTFLAAGPRYSAPSPALSLRDAFQCAYEAQIIAPAGSAPGTPVPVIFTDGASSWNIGTFAASFSSANFVVTPKDGEVPDVPNLPAP
jgi:hypothetical protein